MPELIPEYQGCPSKGLTKSQDDNKHAEDFFLLKGIYSKLVFDTINLRLYFRV